MPLDDLELDLDAVHAGAEATRANGLGRALFLVRVGEQLGGLARERMTSFLVGALAAVDLPLLPPAGRAPIVLYGHGVFPDVLAALLARAGHADVRQVDGDEADLAAVEGAVALFELGRGAS